MFIKLCEFNIVLKQVVQGQNFKKIKLINEQDKICLLCSVWENFNENLETWSNKV